MSDSVLEMAVRSCGLKELKPKQREALLAFIDHRDVFVALPTGYGKSIIYGILPVVFDILKGKDYYNYIMLKYHDFILL